MWPDRQMCSDDAGNRKLVPDVARVGQMELKRDSEGQIWPSQTVWVQRGYNEAKRVSILKNNI